MKRFLQRVLKVFAYTAAGVVILLAIAVGLFRLFLPRLPEYQDEIKGWASSAIGLQVEFSGMDARWGLSGPELAFYDAELIRTGSESRLVAAREVRIGIAVTRLLFDRTLVVDRIVIRDTNLDVRQLENGDWWIQGNGVDQWFATDVGSAQTFGDIELVGQDLRISLMQPGDERPRFFSVPRSLVSVDQHRIAVDADVRLPDDLGRQVALTATRLPAGADGEYVWDVLVDASDINLSGWSQLQPNERWRILSGQGDLELSLAYADGMITDATAEADFEGVSLAPNRLFDISGLFELDVAGDGWLAAVQKFKVATAEHEWPETTLRVEASTDADGAIIMMDLRASYLYLPDAMLGLPWLAEEQRQFMEGLEPSGTIRELSATLSEFDLDLPRYDVALDLDDVGFGAAEGRPGLRGFSGQLRANRAGGRLEIDARDLTVESPEYLAEAVLVDSVDGTVIWRRSRNRIVVLSDSVHLVSPFFESRSNVQLTLPENASPEIDLASSWSISDIAVAKRYIPKKILKPKLYDWFQEALVSGSIPRGTTRLHGPLDKFPFDGGEGQLLVEGSVRDLTFKYQPLWPAAERADLEVVVDNTRLYSVKNRSLNAGNEAIDADVEIADLRDPVLTIKAFVTGTLDTIKDFSMQSPIGDLFGGNLDRVDVGGDATFGLDLEIPLKDAESFAFNGRLRTTNGSLQVAGFDPPFTELFGEVTMTRDEITSEGLVGRFLGEDINIELTAPEDGAFSVVASVAGSVTAEAVISELGVPLEGLISGATAYDARVLFPRAKAEMPEPLTIQVETDLDGLALEFPEPLGKDAMTPLLVRGDLRFLSGGTVIESAGFTENRIAWQIAFDRLDDAWELDRGMVMLGRDVMVPAETRGLHIHGVVDRVRLDDWLSLSRSGDDKAGAAAQIRSIDLEIDNFFALGQHLRGHRVRVDRSALDWLVQLDGEDVVGSIFVPYDFGSDRAMVLDMERLRLPGDDVSPPDDATLDPRQLPPISLKAAEFALGDRHFGAVDVELARVPEGLTATTLHGEDPSFTIDGTGRWVIDDSDVMGSRSFLTATLISTNVEQTMRRLGFAPGIVSDDMRVEFDMSWSGGPRGDFLDVLDGNVQVRFEDGQLEEVEPGAGRIFGLMSFLALPRRLSLDFSDVFNKGFGFDSIAGTFRLEDGTAYTCDLSLEGPAADIGIVGRASLTAREYEQVAVVSAEVGATLPIVGAVVGGPPGAAAMLIFSQIFKKPLQEMSQVYYGIEGSWDAPTIDATNAEDFVRHGLLAGCIDDAP